MSLVFWCLSFLFTLIFTAPCFETKFDPWPLISSSTNGHSTRSDSLLILNASESDIGESVFEFTPALPILKSPPNLVEFDAAKNTLRLHVTDGHQVHMLTRTIVIVNQRTLHMFEVQTGVSNAHLGTNYEQEQHAQAPTTHVFTVLNCSTHEHALSYHHHHRSRHARHMLQLPTTSIEPSTSPPSIFFPTFSPPSIVFRPTTERPTLAPTASPSAAPTNTPTFPTNSPTAAPTMSPTRAPTNAPSFSPTNYPTNAPTLSPTDSPTQAPTSAPSMSPTRAPTASPTLSPTFSPTDAPSQSPTDAPTNAPTSAPTNSPTAASTTSPTQSPTITPTTAPTDTPTFAPTVAPTAPPTSPPTNAPTQPPTAAPTFSPTSAPTNTPTFSPTNFPTFSPTTHAPTADTRTPTASPTISPTVITISPTSAPSFSPTNAPSDAPTFPTASPTSAPTASPSKHPTQSPTESPTDSPTETPTTSPTNDPTLSPTFTPTDAPTLATTSPSDAPTSTPTVSTTNTPSFSPTNSPTSTPTDVPTSSPTITPTTSPTISPTISPTFCPDICDLYNVTLQHINQTIQHCKYRHNCACAPNSGIQQLTVRYMGVSTAAQITFFYNTFTPMCIFHNIEYGRELTCSIPSAAALNSDMVMQDEFPSITYFSIEYADDDDLSPDCIGFIDTSCEYDIAGTLSLECEHLQIVQYIHDHDQICDSVDDIEDHFPFPELPLLDLDTPRKWQYISAHSDSSESHDSSANIFSYSRRKLLQWYDVYYTLETDDALHLQLPSQDDDVDAYKLCDDSAESGDDDEEHQKYQSIVCLRYEIRKLAEKDCGELEQVLLPFCDGNEDFSTNDINDLIVSVSPDGVAADAIKIEPALVAIAVSWNHLSLGTIDWFELCLRNVSVEDKHALIVDADTVDIAPFAGLVLHDEYALCNNSHGLPCLNFLTNDEKKPANDDDDKDDDNNDDIVLQNNNALTMNNARSTDDALKVFDSLSLSLRLILICIGVGIVAGLITVCCICCVHVYYQWTNELQKRHALRRQHRVIKLNPVTSDSTQPMESSKLQHQVQRLVTPTIDELQEEEYDLDHAISPVSSVSLQTPLHQYGDAFLVPPKQQQEQRRKRQSMEYSEIMHEDDDDLEDDACVATTFQSDCSTLKYKLAIDPSSCNTSTNTFKSGEPVRNRNSNAFTLTEDLGSDSQTEEEEYEDGEEDEDQDQGEDIQYDIYVTLI